MNTKLAVAFIFSSAALVSVSANAADGTDMSLEMKRFMMGSAVYGPYMPPMPIQGVEPYIARQIEANHRSMR